MAAYAALLSVKYIIEQLQQHPRPPISMDQNLVQSLIQNNVNFLQDFLEDYSHVRIEEVDRLQSRSADAAYEAEDVIESHIVDQILARSTAHGERINSTVDFYQGLQKVIQDMNLIKKDVMETIKEKGVQYQKHTRSTIPAATSLRPSSIGKNSMVGFDGVLEEITDKLTQRQSKCQIIPIVGMGGIGKTTLAKNVYENPLIVENFDVRGWTTISQEYQVREIFLELLLCLPKKDEYSQESLAIMSEQELGDRLHKTLFGRRYLIIIDDMWDIEVWYQLKRCFPQDNRGSGVIITSRLSNLDSHISDASSIKMNFLNESKSWDLFCKIVFGEDCCPLEMEKMGKKIVENCKGLPLTIVVIGGLLAKSEQTQLYWEYIAENLNSIVNLEDNERCLNLLYMSYNYLPVYLKPCFLYMGVFGEDDAISVSELIKLWVAEGFLKSISGKCLEEGAEEYLKDLVDRNLVLVDKWKRNGEIKSCKMHDLLRDLCLREVEKDKFLYTKRFNRLSNFSHDINTQRRIAIHRHMMEVEKDEDYNYSLEIREALESVPPARSLIQVSTEILPSPHFRLLRVLKAFGKRGLGLDLSIESEFQLVNLRYLSLFLYLYTRWDLHEIPRFSLIGIPPWNLQTLILWHTTLIIVDIWKMPLLRHVEVGGFKLIDPRQDDFVLEKLHTLSYVENFRCSEDMIKRIPNIKKLKLIYDFEFEGSSCCLNNLGCLHKLETLTCNFAMMLLPRAWLQNFTFSHSLKKLTLSDGGLLWEDMSTKIGSLPHLQVLKLKYNACIGHEWRTIEGQFCSLKFLKIAGCVTLKHWITDSAHFPCLEHLVLHFLWFLEEIPSDIGNIATLKLIELWVCGPSVTASAKKIAEEQEELCNEDLQVRVRRGALDPEELEAMISRNFQLI